MKNSAVHDLMANAVRGLAIDGVEAAKSGHPGAPLGLADVATVLWAKHLKFNASKPKWPDRDRFILSAGHASMLIYSLLYLTGVEGMTLDELKRFRQLDSNTPGHPEFGHTLGVETTTGPLGQGLATSVGFALAEKKLQAEFSDAIVDHYTFVLASDGDLMEGISHEAIALAGHLKLNKLIMLWDDNGISIDGPLTLSDSVDQVKRFEAAGWRAERIDGHDEQAIDAAIARAKVSTQPSLIACKTVIGFGAPKKAGSHKVHGEPLGPEEIVATKNVLGLSVNPFSVQPDALKAWRAMGQRSATEYNDWSARLAALDSDKRVEFVRRTAGTRPASLSQAIEAHKKKLHANPVTVATRKASELALEAIFPIMPELISGSADLTPSNNTKAKGFESITPDSWEGRYIHYGIREHGMAAAMNGMVLHGGLVPVGGTFFVFSDYCRPAIRLSALMRAPVVYVMTHDSIGLGEDGPTHQPVEHLAALRAIPNLRLFRPCDAIETAEAWELALSRTDGPTVIVLTRQNLPQLRTVHSAGNLLATGAYELMVSEGEEPQVTIFASGSEVEIAVDAYKLLAAEGIAARVVSIPSLELFLAQPQEVRKALIGSAPIRIAVEAAVRFGWDAVVGEDGLFVGMSSFGASAPSKDLYKHFGITADAIADAVIRSLSRWL
ncbi:transketolase [Beijerinckia indica]|uniref:Transketolase n=1 Tax=Beijerinckia indica subsp. indica (strain ATCC 9039 / DSM 1715 / NCIMB 8712) TaxID=395963 RepID=B2ILE6_BEII9|nr:transketolase [Beijerinckia indica]ACB97346.1 transketolase [Beijerinckia indica subsp. indica ATCC 9039]